MWQITQGYSTDAPPAPPLVPGAGFKEKRKPVTKRLVRWDLKAFTSSARNDGLELMHWVKVRVARPCLSRAGEGGCADVLPLLRRSAWRAARPCSSRAATAAT